MTEERKTKLFADVIAYGAEQYVNCWLCGERHLQHYACVTIHDGHSHFDICPWCFIAGPAGAASRAREYAKELKKESARLQALAEVKAAQAESAVTLATEVEQMTEWPPLGDLLQAQQRPPAFPPREDEWVPWPL